MSHVVVFKLLTILKDYHILWRFIMLYHHCVGKHSYNFVSIRDLSIHKTLFLQFPTLECLPPSFHYPPSFPTLFASSSDPGHPSSSLFLLLTVSVLFLSLSLSGVVSVAGVLLFLTATALTSMTFFSCLVRHQTPALGEATLPHRRRAVAKLCTGTARQWSRTAKGWRWETTRRRGRKKCRDKRVGERKKAEPIGNNIYVIFTIHYTEYCDLSCIAKSLQVHWKNWQNKSNNVDVLWVIQWNYSSLVPIHSVSCVDNRYK